MKTLVKYLLMSFMILLLASCGRSMEEATKDYNNLVSSNNKSGVTVDGLILFASDGVIDAQLGLSNYYGNKNNKKLELYWLIKAAEQGHLTAQNNVGHMYYTGEGSTQDYNQAFKWFTKAANQDHANAQGALGQMYYYGEGIDQDYNQAFKWFTKAANQNNANSQNWLGYMYDTGKGVEQSYDQALKWYTKAAKQGNADAKSKIKPVQIAIAKQNAEQGDADDKFNLYTAYKTGQGIDGIDKDLNKANHWLREAAEQGHAIAQNKLGGMYYYGTGTTQDYKEAFKWYTKVPNQGDANIQNNLGTMYYAGKGVDQDYNQAFNWFEKAAIQDYAQAQNSMGIMYENGQGTEKDIKQAIRWYTKAIKQGNGAANVKLQDLVDKINDADQQQELGDMFYAGTDVDQDYKTALKWYIKAAEQGDSVHQYYLGNKYETTQGHIDLTKALRWYQKATDQDHTNAQLSLKSLEKKITNADTQYAIARMYSNGKDVAKDDKKAFMWHQKAANQNHANSQSSLGYMYDTGKGVEQSYDQALKWYTKAANQGNAIAQSNLAEKYEKGQGTKQDYKQAAKWYQKSVDNGFAKAKSYLDNLMEKITNADTQYAIASMYSDGDDVAKDDKKAFMWHQKAANQNNAKSQNSLGTMYYAGKGVEQSYDQAFNWFKKAANLGLAIAQNNMGIMYEYGKGVKKSYLMAAEYYRLSAKNGYEKGIERANSALLDSIDLDPISKKMTDELYMTKTYDHSVQHKDVKNLSQRVQVYMVGLTGFFGADKYFSYTMQLNESGQIVDTKLLKHSWTYNTLLPPGDGKDMAEFIGEVLWEGGKMYIEVQSSYLNDDSANLIYFKAFPGNEYKGYTITKESITKTVKFYGVNDDGKSEWVIMEFESMKSLINHNSCELSKFVVNSNAGGWPELGPFEVNCEFNKMLTN